MPPSSLDAPDFEGRGAQAVDPRPQGIEEIAQIDDLRLPGGGADQRRAAGQDRGAEDVGGAGHGRSARPAEVDGRADEPPCPADHAAAFQSQVGPEGGESLQVEIDRSVADAAAAGQRHDRPAAAGQERAEHAETRPHPPHQPPSARTGRGSAVCSRSSPSVHATAMPRSSSTRASVRTSASRGTRRSVTGSPARIEAAIIGRAAFFDPLASTVP